ncbi:MAG: zf-HC2 domain-containing protein [Chloroflexota bacterium]|jgi:anti-sigma factor RsiW
MKDCERVQESLGAWLDSELGETDSDWVRAHLAGCAGCREAQRQLEKMTLVLRGALTSEARGIEFNPFWRAVERRIAEKRAWHAELLERARGFFSAPRIAWAVPAAIAAAIALFSVNSYFSGWRGSGARNNFASVDSIDAYGQSVALLREDDTKTTLIWLYQNQEGENETAEEPTPSGPAF